MNEKIKDNYKITFIRGATTASGNSVKEIEVAVVELINELISRNNLIKTNILSITFTATKDLGLVDKIGDEYVARELAAEMVKIDPKIKPVTFGKKKKLSLIHI